MDIRELSYGNYVQNPLGAIGTFRDVREITTSNGKTVLSVKLAYTRSQTETPPFDSYARLSPEEVLPVSLDEDILQAIGFQRNGIFWDYDNREDTNDVIGFRLGQIANGFVLLCNFRTISVRHVHQLQNLMFQCGIKEPLELPLDDYFHFKKTQTIC